MRPVYLFIAVLMITAVSLSQEQQQPAGQTPENQRAQTSVSTGQRTIVGCIAMGAPSGFILKEENGAITPLRTDKDLSAYVGKKVQIQQTWTRTGVNLIESPGESPTTAPGAAKATKTTEFAGDVRMHYKGKVIGDCLK
ncbi:MAG TPA: hypothetical protein VF532_02900 [Candidatus Angelobacter sp.]